MRKLSWIRVAIIIAVCAVMIVSTLALATSDEQQLTPTPEPAPIPTQAPDCAIYDITHPLNQQTSSYEVCFVSHHATMWTYSINEIDPSPSISHWTIYLCPDVTVVNAGGPEGVGWETGTKGGMVYLKFEPLPEPFGYQEFWFQLSEHYGEGAMSVGVKAGPADEVTHMITGPDCYNPPIPEATTTILLGLGAVALGAFVWM